MIFFHSDIDECSTDDDDCDDSTTNCNNNDGSFTCVCKTGYETIAGDSTACHGEHFYDLL